jgi:allantoin racemase
LSKRGDYILKVLVINPVGHPTWDEQDKRIYESFAAQDTEIDVKSLPRGPKSVESAKAYAEVVPLVLEMIKKNEKTYDGFIVNCFLDPGTDLAREITRKPVVGPCKASMTIASYITKRIGIVTVGNEALWLIRDRVESLGYDKYLVDVKGTSFGVLDIDKDRERTLRELVVRAEELKKMGAEVVVLGCTGLAGYAEEVQKRVGIPVIDPAGASIKILESLIKLRVFF